jgi:hypothetical protein
MDREEGTMTNIEGCQLPCVPKFATGIATPPYRSFMHSIKIQLARPWNYYVKRWLKRAYYRFALGHEESPAQQTAKNFCPAVPFEDGELVWVRSRQEVDSTLDPFKELKGCAFLSDMYQYCDTQQRVLKSMHYFIDERDYKRKKVRGVILLEGVICNGTPAFGACDRCCFLFWREEWLRKT